MPDLVTIVESIEASSRIEEQLSILLQEEEPSGCMWFVPVLFKWRSVFRQIPVIVNILIRSKQKQIYFIVKYNVESQYSHVPFYIPVSTFSLSVVLAAEFTEIYIVCVSSSAGSLFTFGAGQSNSKIIDVNLSVEAHSAPAPDTSTSRPAATGSANTTGTAGSFAAAADAFTSKSCHV